MKLVLTAFILSFVCAFVVASMTHVSPPVEISK